MTKHVYMLKVDTDTIPINSFCVASKKHVFLKKKNVKAATHRTRQPQLQGMNLSVS